MERIRIEHRATNYNVGVISKDWQYNISKEMHSSDFGNLIECVDKRLYNQWIDGVNIFELTERQFLKLEALIKKSKYAIK